MDKIQFATNVAQELRLAFLEGKPVEGRFGDQYMYSTVDGRVFYVSVTVGQIIEKQLSNLKVAVGEPIELGKHEVDMGRGRKGIQWLVKRVDPLPEVNGAGVRAPAPESESNLTLNGVGAPATNLTKRPPAIATGWAQALLEQTVAMVDVYAAALRYSTEMHGAAVKPETIQSLMVTCLINMSKGGQRAA